MSTNNGVSNIGGGSITIGNGNAIGPNASATTYTAAMPAPDEADERERADVGVITVLSEEIAAVVDVLKKSPTYQAVREDGGHVFHVASRLVGDRVVKVVAMQTTDRGQRSAVAAYEQLWQHCKPKVVLLVGIAGGIHKDVQLGDVVISDEVIYYDARKETADEIRRRGTSQRMTGPALRMINEFFQVHGEPCDLLAPGRGRPVGFRVFRGPVGSGEAVIAHGDSTVRQYLMAYNDKTLAVETEAGGVGQAFQERLASHPAAYGWFTVRGISDHADEIKDDAYHVIAARRAAQIFDLLLPFIAGSDVAGSSKS